MSASRMPAVYKRMSSSIGERPTWDADGHTVVVGRRIGLSYAAFFRACVNGMDAQGAAQWFLDAETESRDPTDIFGWISDALILAATRHSAIENIALLIQIGNRYRGRVGLPRYHHLIEQLAGFQTSSAGRFHSGCVVAYIRTIDQTLGWANEAPRAEHRLAGWLSPPVTRRLAACGVNTVEELVKLIVKRGSAWWRTVPGLGKVLAQRIAAWAYDCAGDLISRARMVSEADLNSFVPFERFSPPPSLDGRDGENRYHGKYAPGWPDDRRALNCWLDMYRSKRCTFVSYRRYAERIWFWAVLVRGKPLSSLTIEDCRAYFKFLENLPSEWIQEAPIQRCGRGTGDWRPFVSSPSERTLSTHFSATRSLFHGLVQLRYLDDNPFWGIRTLDDLGITSAREDRTKWGWTDPTRTFSQAQYQFLIRYANSQKQHDFDHRAAFVLKFAYFAGLRFGEISDRTLGHLMRPPSGERPGYGWRIKVVGIGGVARAAHIPKAAFDALCEYMVARGYGAAPAGWPRNAPLVEGLTNRRVRDSNCMRPVKDLGRTMKRFFERAARAAAGEHPEWVTELRRAGGLWLRASYARHATEKGVCPVVLSRRLGYGIVRAFDEFERPPVDLVAQRKAWENFWAIGFRCVRLRAASSPEPDSAEADLRTDVRD